MRFLRILPLVWARITWSLSSFTRNIAFGNSSVTVPENSIISSLDICPHRLSDTTAICARPRLWSSCSSPGLFSVQGLQPHRHAARMSLQPLGFGKQHGGRPDFGQGILIARNPGGALEKIEHRKARGKARTAPRRQHMVGAGHVIAHRFRGQGAEKDGSGMADAAKT